jgi:integrase
VVPAGARPGFTKATVSAWRVSLEARGLGSSSIIIRMSAIRKLAAEAADNGLLAPELAAGISRAKSAKSVGIRMGDWLSVRQAQSLLDAPDVTTVRGLLDRAILAVLLGCALRRSEVAALTFCAPPTARRPLVHRRPCSKAWPHPHSADANLGEGGNRRLDRPDECGRRPRIPANEPRRRCCRPAAGRERRMADAPVLRGSSRRSWPRAP